MTQAEILPIAGYTHDRPCPICKHFRVSVPPCLGRIEGETIHCSSSFLSAGCGCDDGLYGHSTIGRCACGKRHKPRPASDERPDVEPAAPPPARPTPLDLGLQNAAAMSVVRPPPTLLVPGLGLVGGQGVPHMFAGEPSSGKTIVVQALLLALLRASQKWAGFSLGKLRRRRAVHLDFEVGEYLLDQRYQRLATGMGFQLRELGDRLERASFPAYRLTPDFRDVWRRLMTDRDFLVIDSLGSAAGFSLNARELVTEMMSMLAELSRETGCRVILIHHLRKTTLASGRHPDPERALEAFPNELCGSGALLANLDAGLGCIGREGEPIFVGQFRARTVGKLIPSFTLDVNDVDERGGRVARDPEHPSPGLRLERGPADAFLKLREASSRAREDRAELNYRERIREVLLARPEGRPKREVQLLARLEWETFQRVLLSMCSEIVEEPLPQSGRRGRPQMIVRLAPSLDQIEAGEGPPS